MTEQAAAEALQFDRADFGANQVAITCSSCKQAIVQSYYDAGGQLLCSACRETMERAVDSWAGTRLAKSFFAGLGAAIAGAIVWWAVREFTGYEVGIVSIAIGFAVGKAVRWGSGNRGGRAYQLLAVFLTYAAVAGNYTPDVVKELMKDDKPAATAQQKATEKEKPVSAGQMVLGLLAILAIAAAAPFLAGFENVIGLAIIAFGLWEAWKLNRRTSLDITGPYSITPVHG